ncbi:MAG: hypothetical protein H6741_07280 [Alphaproteobacteria bacterium]|nr:hypothetical protein [Alphaproteobacteria bacterium]
MTLLLLALACVAPEDPVSKETGEPVVDSRLTDSADSRPQDSEPADDSAQETGEPSGYLGQRVDPPRPPPEFEVLNAERLTRTPEWLAGAPTVVWFFRDASSST